MWHQFLNLWASGVHCRLLRQFWTPVYPLGPLNLLKVPPETSGFYKGQLGITCGTNLETFCPGDFIGDPIEHLRQMFAIYLHNPLYLPEFTNVSWTVYFWEERFGESAALQNFFATSKQIF